ncbi:hypothetical protein H6F71_13165 [Microcoleus sp. FACHB-61]|nr:hypothetical protein [Microcoleus sp. FACHB-61]
MNSKGDSETGFLRLGLYLLLAGEPERSIDNPQLFPDIGAKKSSCR